MKTMEHEVGKRKTYTFGEASTHFHTEGKFLEDFEETADSDEEVRKYLLKIQYRHDEPGLAFRYTYGVEVHRFDEFDDGDTLIILSLVIDPTSCCRKKRQELIDLIGDPELKDSDLRYEDAFFNDSYCIEMASEKLDKPSEEELAEKLDTLAEVLPAYDGLRGLFLDKPLNQIGTTGWDLIKEAKGRIKSAYDLKYLKREHGNTQLTKETRQ